MPVTSMDEIKKYAEGAEVELPGFRDEETITVRLKRPSLLTLAESGKIPNPLLAAASELFCSGIKEDGKNSIKELGELFQIIAKASLVSPSYDELTGAGVQLTDSQLLYIYNYVRNGVDSLRRFREKQGARKNHDTGKNL